jgi:hypothetical protein
VHVHAVHAGKTFGFRMRFTMVPDYGSSEGAFPGIGDKYRNIVSRQRPSRVSGARVADAVTDRDRLVPVQSAETREPNGLHPAAATGTQYPRDLALAPAARSAAPARERNAERRRMLPRP